MQRGRKIVALTLAVLLVLSAMSCFAFAAPVYSVLPEGYMVVDADWTGLDMQEAFDYELGGELYRLEYGVTAFSSVEAASAAWMPAGLEKTIVLTPGTYGTAMNLTSDVNLSGPYFGKNPNNNPHLDDYDPSLADWALKNDRSIDPEKEAVFTADILIGTGCNNVTIDGIAFTGAGRIKDTARAAEKIIVNYTFKNLYFENSSCDSYFLMNSNVINRYITIDSIRAVNNSTISRFHNTKAEELTLKNSYAKDMNAGADKSTNSVMEYLGGITPENCISFDKRLVRRYQYNHFENFGGINTINFAARESGVNGIQQRHRVIIELIGNEFVDVATATGNRVIQDQISYHNQEFICKDNLFMLTSGDGTPAFGTYYDGVGGTPSFTHMEISGNRFDGYKTPFSSSSSYPYYFDSTNVATNKGASVSIATGSAILKDLGPNMITEWKDADIIRNDTKRKIYIYPSAVDVSNGFYNFDFDTIALTESGVALKAYTDSSRATEINRIALNKEDTITQAFVRATKGSSYEDYEVIIFAFPPTDIIDTSGSDDCKLHLFGVPGANKVDFVDGAYYVEMPENTNAIKPSVNVDEEASYKFYLDADCKLEASNTDTVKLYAKDNIFYIQVTAENGTLSDPIPVIVTSVRKAVQYSDAASVPAYARKAVNYLNNEGFGVFVGDQNKKLNPRANINRYELAKVIVTLCGINVEMAESVKLNEIYDDFFDMQKEAPWALPYIRAATAVGLIQGVSDKNDLNFAGSASTTREQFTAVFMRSVAMNEGTTVNALYKKNAKEIDNAFSKKYSDEAKISSWALKSIKLANYHKIIQGDGKNFNPLAKIIRADVAVIVYNHSLQK